MIGESGLAFAQVDPSFMSLGTALQDQVPNPFFGIITNPSSPLRFETVSRNRLLRPFPQYDGVSAFRVPGSKSIYHAMTGRLDKRFSGGLSLLMSYTLGKLHRRCLDDGRLPGSGGHAAERLRSRVGPLDLEPGHPAPFR